MIRKERSASRMSPRHSKLCQFPQSFQRLFRQSYILLTRIRVQTVSAIAAIEFVPRRLILNAFAARPILHRGASLAVKKPSALASPYFSIATFIVRCAPEILASQLASYASRDHRAKNLIIQRPTQPGPQSGAQIRVFVHASRSIRQRL